MLIRCLVLSLMVSASIAVAQEGATKLVPEKGLMPADIGLQRHKAEIVIPKNHKLLVLTRVYHKRELHKAAFFEYLPGAKDPSPGYGLSASIWNPDEFLPEPTGKLKLSLPGINALWLDRKGTTGNGTSASTSENLRPGFNHQLFRLHVDGPMVPIPGKPGSLTSGAPEWEAFVFIRFEPLTDKELAREHADVPGTIHHDPEKYPAPQPEKPPEHPSPVTVPEASP